MSRRDLADGAIAYPRHNHTLWRRIVFNRESWLLVALAVIVVIAMEFVPNFDEPITLTFLLLDTATILLILLPMTMIIITGEIDLSVGSIFGVASVFLGLFYQAHVPLIVAGLIAVIAGGLIGAINGLLVTVVGLPSLAVTIGTLALFGGLAVGLLGTTAITDFPSFWTDLAQADIGSSPIPLIAIPIVVLSVLFVVLLHSTPFGRGVYAIGLGRETAEFSGVNVGRTKVVLFVVSGLVSAFAGVFYTLQYQDAVGDNGVGLELQVITAVVLGGVSIFGGRGRIIGAIVAALIIGVLSAALQLASVKSNVIDIVTGGVLILSVVLSSVVDSLQKRRRSTRSNTAASAATRTESDHVLM